MGRAVRIGYDPRPVFEPFHERTQRWACIVAHRRAGKTVAAVQELVRDALLCDLPEPRFAYVAPFTSLVLGMAPTDPGGKWWAREVSASASALHPPVQGAGGRAPPTGT